MLRRVARLVVNAAVLGMALVQTFPLLWLVLVSLVHSGEASAIPPPLLPARASFDNYRELFAHGGLWRYLANSVFLATTATLASLVFNVAAGYAFAKLRFPGRERIFRTLLGALVIPGQVAMVPLFLLLKQLVLVNSYGAVIA